MRVFEDGPREARGKFAQARRALSEALVERDEEVDLVLTALVAREHVLLVGPPGCAKSLLLDALLNWLEGGCKFSLLLTKFTAPEELLGPVSLAGLKEDRYRRVTAGRLPEAHLCFLDEVFKGSSAILNALLRVLNERCFDDGGERRPVPLLLCVAAGNEWPAPESGKELHAAFDRFLLRKEVRPVRTREGRRRLLWGEEPRLDLGCKVTPEEVAEAHEGAMALPWSDEAKEALEAVLLELAREGVCPGDRRQRKAARAAQAYAWLCGADEVLPEHLEVLAHALWDSPEEQPLRCAQVIARVANPPGMRVSSLLLEAEEALASADPRDLAKAATAAAKLAEIERSLAGIKGDGRAQRARLYVQEQARQLKLASLASL